MTPTLNGDLSVRVVLVTPAMSWSPSPSGAVWRKRLHLVGPAESGQVTSIVRYERDSTFPPHDHPGGEEILVLDGVFSDEHGDWPAGTYLLNPEGFHHAPFSREGCVLFVKLRQFPGRDRQHVVLSTRTLPWTSAGITGVLTKSLYQQPGYSDSMRLEKWAPGTKVRARHYERGAELLLLEGSLDDDRGTHAAGTWQRFPAGLIHDASSAEGCTLYLKEGGFAYLHSVAS